METDWIARELGVLAFNSRVLSLAQNPQVPLLERLRFLCIVSSNLDEFFEVRLSSARRMADLGGLEPAQANSPQSDFMRIASVTRRLVASQYRLLQAKLLPGLARHGVRILYPADWSGSQRIWLKRHFNRHVLPLLTPIGLDPAQPFPRLLNKSLNVIVQLKGRDVLGRPDSLAIVQVPRLLPRIIRLPTGQAGHHFALLSSLLRTFASSLFSGMEVHGAYPFRVTRNSDLYIDEEDAKDPLTAIQVQLPERHFGDAVRLEIGHDCPERIERFLARQLELNRWDVYRVKGPVNLARLLQLADMVDLPKLKYPAFIPGRAPELRSASIFRDIAHGDILLHHPYQSFSPVLEFLAQAARDPDVVAIKQTIYRTGNESALMEALIEACHRGKEVTVIVELMARFDEEANLVWARRLEDAGAHVVFGIAGQKTHAKMLMVVRREQGNLRRYAHLSTGNYHPGTARLYTDFGLLTANAGICQDIDALFRQLTGRGKLPRTRSILLSPFAMHAAILEAIAREKHHARAGRNAGIVAKMNSLVEPEIITALYSASRAGVRINLVVRGACLLRPGISGLSENIAVRSIVGRLLEHHRIFMFVNGGKEDVYLSSADWMERNFFRRVEIAFPVLDSVAKRRVIEEGLLACLNDQQQSWLMGPHGNYRRASKKPGYCAQRDLLERFASPVGQASTNSVARIDGRAASAAYKSDNPGRPRRHSSSGKRKSA